MKLWTSAPPWAHGHWVCWSPSQLSWWRQGDTQGKSPARRRADRDKAKNIFTQTHTYGQFRMSTLPHMLAFGMLEQAKEPGENLQRHRKNLQTPYRKAPHMASNTHLLQVGIMQTCVAISLQSFLLLRQESNPAQSKSHIFPPRTIKSIISCMGNKTTGMELLVG